MVVMSLTCRSAYSLQPPFDSIPHYIAISSPWKTVHPGSGQFVVFPGHFPMAKIFMSFAQVQVEGWIKILHSLVVQRISTIERFLIPSENLFRRLLVSGNIVSRDTGVIVVFAFFPCLDEKQARLFNSALCLCPHSLNAQFDDRIGGIHRMENTSSFGKTL